MHAQQDLPEGKHPWPPCRYACPVHADVRSYVNLIAQGKYAEALEVIRRRLPFAAVCGRICHHPCEQNCRRWHVDAGIAVRELKRYVAEHPVNEEIKPEPGARDRERVAVIGGGPSGMSAALELARRGYRPTIFEKEDIAGGIPNLAIPRYRLPRSALQRDIDWILAHGIELRTGVRIGKDKTIGRLHEEGYAALIVAAGMSSSRILPLPGAESPRVYGVLEFLKAVAAERDIDVGRDILVIGGGNVACDAARSAARLCNARVRMICLENDKEMPAWQSEIEEAVAEGVEIMHRLGPVAVETDAVGRVTGLRHKKVTRVFDAQGRFNPEFDERDTGTAACDTVIFAIGQAVNTDFIRESGLELDDRGRLQFNPLTQQTNVDWIFACGEAVTPPGSVVEACASGLRAAEAVDQFLQTGRVEIEDILPEQVGRIDPWAAEMLSRKDRVQPAVRDAGERRGDFQPFVATLSEAEAVAEARRCMECGSGAETIASRCVKCLTCVRICPYQAPHIDTTAHISRERCQACGICFSDCPANAICMLSGTPEVLAEGIGPLISRLPSGAGPKIVAYICGRSASASQCSGEISAGPENCAEIYLPNPGLLDSRQLLHTLEQGADAVLVVVCGPEHEHHRGTSLRLRKRVARLREDLAALGMNRERLQEFELPDHGIEQIEKVLRQGRERLVAPEAETE